MNVALTESIASDWEQHAYYDEVEDATAIDGFWSREKSFFRQAFDKLDLNFVLEIACGHGRHAAQIIDEVGRIIVTDVNKSNIDYCRERFKAVKNVDYLVNNGRDLADIPSHSLSTVFSYDAMVHFEFTDVMSYLTETSRILDVGGRGLFHHSNLSRYPGRVYRENPHWRNFMSAELFSHVASRAGLRVLEQKVFDWGASEEEKNLDCLTLVEKP